MNGTIAEFLCCHPVFTQSYNAHIEVLDGLNFKLYKIVLSEITNCYNKF